MKAEPTLARVSAARRPAGTLQRPFEPIHRWIGRRAASAPRSIAIEFAGGSLTFGELAQAVAELVGRLRRAGVDQGDLVGVATSDREQVVVALLAVLEVGGLFMPIDPEFQAATLGSLITAAEPSWWLVAPEQAEAIRAASRGCGVDCSCLDLFPVAKKEEKRAAGAAPAALSVIDPELPCYVYFTSGSSGQPKGIVGRLKALDHYAGWMHDAFDVGSDCRFSQLISPAWDGFLLDVFVPLSAGGTVVAPPDRTTLLDGARLVRWLDQEQISHMHCTPSLLRSLLNQPLQPRLFRALRWLMLVGEAVLPSDVARWMEIFGERVRLVNLYGPSETTLTKLFYCISSADGAADTVPIGGPMPGARVLVVDERGQPCPPGREGEILIRTPYRSLGYLRQPELSAKVFVQNPFSDRTGDLVYRTGDLGRTRADGLLEFIGRRDGQVKIRGVRVELVPIESLLSSHPAVNEVVVVERRDRQGGNFLCAFLSLGQPVERGELRAFLLSSLPEIKVPSAFVVMESLPRTLTGKIDRGALPEPNQSLLGRGQSYRQPRNPVEQKLAAVFGRILNLERVGIDDSFFELGGHSLLSMELLSGIRDELGVELPLGQIFEHPTIVALARVVAQGAPVSAARSAISPVELGDGEFPLSFSQQRLWFVDQLSHDATFLNIADAVELRGEVSPEVLRRALERTVERQEALRTAFAERGGEPVQMVGEPWSVALPEVDLRSLPEAQRDSLASRHLAQESRRVFDLRNGRLLRCRLLRLADQRYLLICVIHHIIADWWSFGVLVRELTSAYEDLAAGRSCTLPELAVQGRDFALWERRWMVDEVLEQQLVYWRERLQGCATFHPLPLDFPRPSRQIHAGDQVDFEWPRPLAARLVRLAEEQGCSRFMLGLALFQIVVAHLVKTDDVVISAPVSFRDRPEVEPLIGFFVNTLLFRAQLAVELDFGGFLLQVRQRVVEAFDHQHLPLERLIEERAPQRSLDHTPLLQIGYSFFELASTTALRLNSLRIEPFPVVVQEVQFELNLIVRETGDGLAGTLQYQTALFERSTVERFADLLVSLAEAVAEHPEASLGELRQRLVTAEQSSLEARREVLGGWARQRFSKRRRTVVRAVSRAASNNSASEDSCKTP